MAPVDLERPRLVHCPADGKGPALLGTHVVEAVGRVVEANRHVRIEVFVALHLAPVRILGHEARADVRVLDENLGLHHLHDLDAYRPDLLVVRAGLVVFEDEHALHVPRPKLLLIVYPHPADDVRGDIGGHVLIDRAGDLAVVVDDGKQPVQADRGRVVGRLRPEQARRPFGGDRADQDHLHVGRPVRGQPVDLDVVRLGRDDLLRRGHPERAAHGILAFVVGRRVLADLDRREVRRRAV